jgi:hypothetical protein
MAPMLLGADASGQSELVHVDSRLYTEVLDVSAMLACHTGYDLGYQRWQASECVGTEVLQHITPQT